MKTVSQVMEYLDEQGCDKEHPKQQYVSHKIVKIEWEK